MKVILMGSNPSPRNHDPAVPFHGTPSGNELKRWLDASGLQWSSFFQIVNACDVMIPGKKRQPTNKEIRDTLSRGLQNILASADLVVCLGETAAKAMIFADTGVPFVKLAHPSPVNQLLNDPSIRQQQIEKLRSVARMMGA